MARGFSSASVPTKFSAVAMSMCFWIVTGVGIMHFKNVYSTILQVQSNLNTLYESTRRPTNFIAVSRS